MGDSIVIDCLIVIVATHVVVRPKDPVIAVRTSSTCEYCTHGRARRSGVFEVSYALVHINHPTGSVSKAHVHAGTSDNGRGRSNPRCRISGVVQLIAHAIIMVDFWLAIPVTPHIAVVASSPLIWQSGVFGPEECECAANFRAKIGVRAVVVATTARTRWMVCHLKTQVTELIRMSSRQARVLVQIATGAYAFPVDERAVCRAIV